MLKYVPPQEVNQWSGGDCKLEEILIVNFQKFIVKWNKWWSQMQCSSQCNYVDNGLLEPNVLKDWSGMQKWGKDGMVIVMITLVWWGMASVIDEWLKAVQDVSKVLHCRQDCPPTVGFSTTATQPRVNRKHRVPQEPQWSCCIWKMLCLFNANLH